MLTFLPTAIRGPMITAQQLVILDRDGVINHDSDAYIKSLDEWIPYPSAIRAIAWLTQAGFTVAVATNQSASPVASTMKLR